MGGVPKALVVGLESLTYGVRVGYEFCAAVMPPEHELHLMLVNTFRKVKQLF